MSVQLTRREKISLRRSIRSFKGDWEKMEVRKGISANNERTKLATFADENGNWHFFAFQNERLVGSRTIQEISTQVHSAWVLRNILVRRKGQSIGSLLTAEALEKARQNDAPYVTVGIFQNEAWQQHLIRELGGQETGFRSGGVNWSRSSNYGREKWKRFLLRES